MVKKESEDSIPIKTSHGVRYVDKKDIIHFKDGLFGFSGYTDFAIFNIKDCEPFKSMLSAEEGGPDFVVVEPASIFDDYSPLDSINSPGELDIGTPGEIVVLSIVTLSEKPEDITINLRGPLLVNLSTSQARQVILENERYQTRFPVLVKE